MLIFQMKLPHAELVIDVSDQSLDDPHEHKDLYQLLIPLKGSVVSWFNGRSYTLERGISTLKNPETTHWHELREPSKSIIVSWSREEFSTWCSSEGIEIGPDLTLNEKQIIMPESFLKHMNRWAMQQMNDDDATSLAGIQSEVFELLSRLSRDDPGLSVTVLDNISIQRAITYIHDRYADPITLEDLMAVANQSKYHFIRSFKKATGYSPYNYILAVRINRAKALLRDSKATVQQISDTLGFSSVNHFTRTFQNLTGVSPKAFRDGL
ncbi:helix-turn-helix transcriptional regulator (plasmid) [Paenibacillus cellulosilyticus]|uniref:AraC family transcriptional regulator n=1 Tax=Paenibacillus cellulosilyticus TaxID=375489 RepID=UPI000D71CAC5|nr:AraC family transcriptional regulator [Paenibacillus cellulosilyticus]QKS48438.1 helix-turn-helix transcriptional regulator [Paenibacillus cellulosilyticus]